MNINKLNKLVEKEIKEIGLLNVEKMKLCVAVGLTGPEFMEVTKMPFADYIYMFRDIEHPQVKYNITRNRVDPQLRRDQILSFGVIVARKVGYHRLTRDDVAIEIGVSKPTISYHFTSIAKLRNEILKTAIKLNDLEVMAQGFMNKDIQIQKLSATIKKQILKYINNGY